MFWLCNVLDAFWVPKLQLSCLLLEIKPSLLQIYNGQQVRLPPEGERHRHQLHLQRVGEHGLGVLGSSASARIAGGRWQVGQVGGSLVKLLKGWMDVKYRGISSCSCGSIISTIWEWVSHLWGRNPELSLFCSWGGTDLWTPNRWGLNAESCGAGPECAWRFRGPQRFFHFVFLYW